MKKLLSRMAFVLAIPLVGPVEAQQMQVLNLDKAIKLGLEQSKFLKIAQAKMDVATAKSDNTKEALIPTVDASFGLNRLNELEQPGFLLGGPNSKPTYLLQSHMDAYLGILSVKEVVFSGFRYKYSRESVIYLEQASKLDYENNRQEVVLNTANAYYNIYKIKATKKLLEENLKQTAENLNEVKNYEQQGIATHNDVLKVQLQRSNLQLSLIEIDNTLKTALYNFNLILGLEPNAATDIDTTLVSQNASIQDYNALQQKALDRSDIKAANLRMLAASSGLKSNKSKYYPTCAVSGGYYFINPNSEFIPPSQQYFSIWTAGVTLSYDITGIYTNKNHVKEALAQQKQSQAAYEMATDGAKMEVNQTYLDYAKSKDKVGVAKESVQQAEENYKIVKSKYSNQVAKLTDLLEANLMLLQAHINLSNAKADVELANYKVQKATGDIKY